MKKIVFFGLLAMALAFGLIGCGGDNGDDGPKVTGTYEGTADGETIVLKIMDDGTFVLTIGGKTSKGTATKDGDSWILTPAGSDEDFTVTVSPQGITEMDGTVTFTDGNTQEAPHDITPKPPTPPAPTGGKKLTVTGIPNNIAITTAELWTVGESSSPGIPGEPPPPIGIAFEDLVAVGFNNNGTFAFYAVVDDEPDYSKAWNGTGEFLIGLFTDDDVSYGYSADGEDPTPYTFGTQSSYTIAWSSFIELDTKSSGGGTGPSENDSFAGTWTGTITIPASPGGPSEPRTLTVIMTFEDATFESSSSTSSGSILSKGTYTYTNTTVTTNPTEVNYMEGGESATGGWTSSGEFFEMYGNPSTLTLSNGQLTFTGFEGFLTKG